MDFTARTIINGKSLANNCGKNVSLLVNISEVDASGRTLTGKTSDNTAVRVSLSEPVSTPVQNWVEILGTPTGSDAIRCKEVHNNLF